MSDQSAFASFIVWLKERHNAVFAAESEALRLLEAGDASGYTVKMREKAEMLASLADDVAPLLAVLPAPLRARQTQGVRRFSASASNALRINSVFYMSALCYPEDHKKGQPDDLAVYIGRIEAEGL